MEFRRIGVCIVEKFLKENRELLVISDNAKRIVVNGGTDGAYYEVCYIYDGDNISYDCELKFYNDENIPF